MADMQDADGLPDLLVANSESNNVYLLPGVGNGFFDDQNPVIYQTGVDPVDRVRRSIRQRSWAGYAHRQRALQ